MRSYIFHSNIIKDVELNRAMNRIVTIFPLVRCNYKIDLAKVAFANDLKSGGGKWLPIVQVDLSINGRKSKPRKKRAIRIRPDIIVGSSQYWSRFLPFKQSVANLIYAALRRGQGACPI